MKKEDKILYENIKCCITEGDCSNCYGYCDNKCTEILLKNLYERLDSNSSTKLDLCKEEIKKTEIELYLNAGMLSYINATKITYFKLILEYITKFVFGAFGMLGILLIKQDITISTICIAVAILSIIIYFTRGYFCDNMAVISNHNRDKYLQYAANIIVFNTMNNNLCMDELSDAEKDLIKKELLDILEFEMIKTEED